MTPVESQLAELARRWPRMTHRRLPSGAVLVAIPDVPLPPGWSRPKTTLRIVAPVGYPMSQPDCFWIDADIRLANGAMPRSANLNPIPETSEHLLWFSWHLARPWDPNRDTLMTWAGVVQNRLRDPS